MVMIEEPIVHGVNLISSIRIAMRMVMCCESSLRREQANHFSDGELGGCRIKNTFPEGKGGECTRFSACSSKY
jgi:hypothetical protein